MSNDSFLLDDEDIEDAEVSTDKWKVLIVDDEESVHLVTKTSLKNKLFDNKKLDILSAMSGEEARKILHEHDDIALALIDVVMETPEAGLELVNYIRQDMRNSMIRLVLRTGQPAQAPEEYVINFYDINDYKEKTELTSQKLFTLVRTSLKQYDQYKQLHDSRDAIYEKMTTNELTQLPNRMKLNEYLDSEGNKSLILINIDNFSSINETQGFDVGDGLLKAFASYLDNTYTNNMKIFHINGDVFALLCFDHDESALENCMKNLKANIAAQRFSFDSISIHVTVSLGIVLKDSGNLIQKAELAIKEARSYGRNNSQVYSDDLNIIRTIHANSLWTDRIRIALKENKIHAYFQAIKNYKTNKIEKFETLVRLEHEGEVYTPYHFLEAAMYGGYIYDIFKIMFEAACIKAGESEYDFSVNVSEMDLRSNEIYDYIVELTQKYKIVPGRITLEILEYKSITNEEQISELITKIHEYGIRISIDDFGTGCSNFSQLNNIPIDFIKIDGSFIKDIIDNKDSQIVSRTIIDFAHQKNISVIAEFVSEEDIYEYVKKIGADYAQGYFIFEPRLKLPG